jgi:uncharacterized Fe-S cluster protein YjdI
VEQGKEASEADASAGGTGAPPAPERANQARSELTRAYETEAIRVLWYAGRCIHSAACIRALPSVFDPRRRPWIEVAAADADAVADAVRRCPTGALHYERLDGGAAEVPVSPPEVRALRDGPYVVRGDVTVVDESGTVLRRDTRVALCRCGQSRHMPMCDNTHRAVGFRSAPG